MIAAQSHPSTPTSPPFSPPPAESEQVPLWRSGVVAGLALIVLLIYWLNPSAVLQPQSGVEMRLPGEVGDFIGHNSPISPAELTILPKDTEFVRRTYEDFKDHEIMCSIVLSGAEERSIHRPEVCLIAQGWSIVSQENIPIHLNSGRDLVVRNLHIEREVVTPDNLHHKIFACYMYWFVGEGMTTPSHFTRIFVSSWDRIFYGKAHRWAYVIAMSNITQSYRPDGLDEAQTKTMLTDFIRGAIPTFQKTEMTADTL